MVIRRDLSISTCTPYAHAIPRGSIYCSQLPTTNVPSTWPRYRPHGPQQRAKATRQEEGAVDIPDLVCDIKRVGCDGVFFIQLADKPLTENPIFLNPRKLSVNAVKATVEAALLLACLSFWRHVWRRWHPAQSLLLTSGRA
jgi:hypothetical protein